jgi:7-cyano-7-deazaguanine tRNA-ribosyltransferase
MREAFEIRAQDGAGRLGDLRVPRAGVTVETPALLPVVNPNVVTVDPSRFRSFGAEMLITNAYIIHGNEALREQALSEGLHEMLDFEGAIMTDSGSFQLSEYGAIDVDTEEILAFQRDIGSDVGTPVDIPTPPDADRERAERELATTTDRLAAAEAVDTGEMLVTAPVQGSTYPDLRERAARDAYATDLDVFPVGAVVPLLNDYRYADTVEAVLAAKRGLGVDAPVHLFGGGHPMTFALAVAAGCDLFDSAAYALYARDGRYLTPRGTRHLDDLEAFPCGCQMCAEHTPEELRRADDEETERRLAEHNLAASFAEMRRVRQAVREGTLLELVEARAHAHPRVLDGYRLLLDYADQLERSDPASKRALFYCSADSARRPEVSRHRERLARIAVPDSLLLVEPPEPAGDYLDADSDPARALGVEAGDDAEAWVLRAPLGPCPPGLLETYPLNAEIPARMDRAGHEAAARGVVALLEHHPDSSVTVAHRDWPASALAVLPDGVATRCIDDEVADR